MNAILKSEHHASTGGGATVVTLPLAADVPLAASPVRKPAPVVRGAQPFARAVKAVLPPLVGIAFVVLVWQLIATRNETFPSPLATFQEALKLFADPFYHNSPNDQGIGWNVLASLKRVAVGFGLAALVGIPLGFIIGRVRFVSGMFGPIISLLKPVSPLAWLPIGLLVFKSADPAAIWSIFICSIWPMLINTAFGVAGVRKDWLNVARTLEVSPLRKAFLVILPAAAPTIITGMRISMGIAWLVIVAAEMLIGGNGIGYFLWNEWNNLSLANVLFAVLMIGVVGMALDLMFAALQKKVTYAE